jgi:hypothetical protein
LVAGDVVVMVVFGERASVKVPEGGEEALTAGGGLFGCDADFAISDQRGIVADATAGHERGGEGASEVVGDKEGAKTEVGAAGGRERREEVRCRSSEVVGRVDIDMALHKSGS